MSESQKSNNDEETSNIFDKMPFFEHIDKNLSNILLNNSISKITNLFSFISNKLMEINDNKGKEKNIDISNFEKLKKEQEEFLNNSINKNDLNYIYILKLINSQIILYNFITEIFLEKYIKIKFNDNNDIYNTMKNIIDNIFSNYNIFIDIIFKLSEKFEEMNEEIKKKDKYIKQFLDNNTILNEKLNKKQIENNLITKKLLDNNLNNSFNQNSYYNNNKYTKNALKSRLYNNNENINSKNKLFYQKNNSYRHSSNNIFTNSNQQNSIITNLYLTGYRKFTPKMFKDLIYNIYEAKEAFNKKCIENKNPKETMEQFIYTYFNYKYGLKNMVIEWATNIINGIKNYSLIDSEICLFGKILRNELDESSHMIMPQLKKSINENFMNILRKEYSYKNEEEIIEEKNKLIKNRLPLNIVELILDSLYTKEEQEKIKPNINMSINDYKEKSGNQNNILYNLYCKNNKDSKYHKKFTRIEISQKIVEKENELNTLDYNDLLEICHEYQMNIRELYLKPFVEMFKYVDDDNDGILNEVQFINLIKIMNIFDENNLDEEINNLLNTIDPYGNKIIIFTDCVRLFSYNNENGESIIDKIYNNYKYNYKGGENNSENKMGNENIINENLDEFNRFNLSFSKSS